ncbi:MAG: AMP-binding protein [Pseudomonadota bacterium]
MKNLASHLTRLAERSDDRQQISLSIAGRGGVLDNTFMLPDLLSRAANVAFYLVREVSGDRIGLAFPAGIEFVESFLACVLAGKIAVPIPAPRQGPQSHRIASVLAIADIDHLVCLGKDKTQFESLIGHVHSITAIDEIDTGIKDIEFSSLPGFSLNSDELIFLQYTSGSTHEPKGVGISSANILSNAKRAQRAYVMSDEHVVNWMPHFHDMGLVGGILIPLVLGMPSVQMSPMTFLQRPLDFLKLVQSLPAVVSGAPPFALSMLMDRVPAAAAAKLDLCGWRRLFCGGETVPAGLLDQFHRHFAAAGIKRDAIFATYGMAEVTLYAAGGYNGKPNHGTVEAVEPCLLTGEDLSDLLIIDAASGNPVREGQTGEIALAGHSLGKVFGTASPSVGQSGVLVAGRSYVRTGDIGKIVGGNLYVTGRTKDILIVNGHNFMASEIEWFAASQSASLNPLAAAAYQVDETQACYLEIELRDKRVNSDSLSELADIIEKLVAARFGVKLSQVTICPRGSLPRTSSGKIRRAAVKDARSQAQRETSYA